MDQIAAYRAFAAIVEHESFSKAAASLGLSRGMVSKQLADLEEHLGARLLNRTTRSLGLTEIGAQFHADCQTILAQIEAAEHAAAQMHVRPRGTLRVNAPFSFGSTHVAPSIPAFLARFPEVTVHLTFNNRVVDLVEEGFDMAVRIGRMPDSSLVAKRLATARLICAAAPFYVQAHPAITAPADLLDHNCLLYTLSNDGATWPLIGPDGIVHPLRVTGNLRADNGEALAEAACEGLGVVLLPTFVLDRYFAAGRLVRVLPDHACEPLPIHAVFPPSRRLSAKVRAFADHLALRLTGEV
ncbi:LysR family transcriptional regulator [Magnetospirillum moscoviense]|uniref:HTH lysR-type domain-containing protein n=1 Tax=Magnetospirillum moscoviense TaxID=1437059 RepID=A0A178MKL2_9PROT|nr:LysR family transcriptional regulator [Magnetospirillum moscoviense]OAN48544.1 hypothetical protein A6A05_15125 [Magnetospirillum moscoviense]